MGDSGLLFKRHSSPCSCSFTLTLYGNHTQKDAFTDRVRLVQDSWNWIGLQVCDIQVCGSIHVHPVLVRSFSSQGGNRYPLHVGPERENWVNTGKYDMILLCSSISACLHPYLLSLRTLGCTSYRTKHVPGCWRCGSQWIEIECDYALSQVNVAYTSKVVLGSSAELCPGWFRI